MKQRIIALILALFVGMYGLHLFYLNDNKRGMKYLIWTIVGILTSWLFIGLLPLIIIGISALVDAFRYATMSDEEFNEKFN